MAAVNSRRRARRSGRFGGNRPRTHPGPLATHARGNELAAIRDQIAIAGSAAAVSGAALDAQAADRDNDVARHAATLHLRRAGAADRAIGPAHCGECVMTRRKAILEVRRRDASTNGWLQRLPAIRPVASESLTTSCISGGLSGIVSRGSDQLPIRVSGAVSQTQKPNGSSIWLSD